MVFLAADSTIPMQGGLQVMLFYFGFTVFAAGALLSLSARVWALIPVCVLIFAVLFAAGSEHLSTFATMGYCVLAAIVMQLGYFVGLFGRHFAFAAGQPQPKESFYRMSKSRT
jgi:hypothetical protein